MAGYLELISAILGISGAILNVLKNKWGFALWIVGNSLWIIYGIITKQYFFMIQYIVFVSISIWGFKKWLSEDKGKIKNGRRK
jgi:nicotinamide riboside transporter PnuC